MKILYAYGFVLICLHVSQCGRMHLRIFIHVIWFRGCWKEKILVFQIHLIMCHWVQLILVTWVISEEEFGKRIFNQSIGDIYFDFYFKCGRHLESCGCGWTWAGSLGTTLTVLLFRQPDFHSLCGRFLLGYSPYLSSLGWLQR